MVRVILCGVRHALSTPTGFGPRRQAEQRNSYLPLIRGSHWGLGRRQVSGCIPRGRNLGAKGLYSNNLGMYRIRWQPSRGFVDHSGD